MRTMRHLRTYATVLALTAATLVGCGSSDDEQAAPVTVTSTADETTTEATTTAETQASTTTNAPEETATETVTETPPGDTPPPGGSNPTRDDLPYEPVGSQVTIDGEPATVCIYGDGWGTNIWAANSNTNCEFVSAVHNTVISGLNATTDNIRDHLPPSISVSSPVTGQTYELGCEQRGDVLVACTGGDDAAVYFY